MSNLSDSQVQRLFSIVTTDEVESFLTDIGAMSGRGWRWVPLGGRDNNAGSVNLAVEAGQALVERITNGMDAHIELQYELANRPDDLDSPRAAVAQLWSLDTARLSRESPQVMRFIEEMAPKNVIRAVGSTARGKSSIIFEDRGIGQHPEDFPTTVLSLGGSNKVRKPYLMGAFGQGGSSTFAYCPYSVIVSRRHGDCLDGKPDLVGWSVVRQYDDDSLKLPRYEYLVGEDTGIPTLAPSRLESLRMPFESGTRIVHIAYDLGKLSTRWSLVGYRYFDNLLFDPVLPYRLEDHRGAAPFNRNLYGARNRLDQVDSAGRAEAQNYDVDLARWGGQGRLRIRYWVFRPTRDASDDPEDERGVKLDSYLDYNNSTKTIVFTLNGQRHHAQEKRIVREARLSALADYLLIHVDCDGLSRRLKKEIFPATRSGATTGEQREDLLLQAVKLALSDPWLGQKMEEIVRRRQGQITTESARRVQRMLDRLISVFRTEQRPGGQRGWDEGGASRTGEHERQTHDPPGVFRFADHRRFEMCSGQTATIYLLTDGPDNLLARRVRGGRIRLACDGDQVASFTVAGMHKGRIPVHVHIPSAVPSGRRARIVAELEVEPATFLTDSRELRVVPPPQPYVGVEPPTLFDFAKTTPLHIEVGRRASAEIHTDAKNDILDRAVRPALIQASCDIPDVFVAIRGPRDGEINAEVHANSEATPEAEGTISVTLTLDDGTILTTSRSCMVIPAREHERRSGVQTAPVPAYRVIHVWRDAPENDPDAVTWTAFPNAWNEERVGKWEMNGDDLYLYVNMNERQFQNERSSLSRRFGESHAERLADRHVAYIAFHLFQLHEQSEARNNRQRQAQPGEPVGQGGTASEDSTLDDPDSPEANQELQRVTATLVQALRSEAELIRLEAATND